MLLTDIKPQSSGPETLGSRGFGNSFLIYFTLCASFAGTIFIADMVQGGDSGSADLYCAMLFAICAGPVLFGRHNPGRRLISMFMGCYFVIFGIHPTVQILTGQHAPLPWAIDETTTATAADSALTSDAVVILGALAVLVGYFLTSALSSRRASTFLNHEWRYSSILKIGVILYAIGFAEMIAYQLNVSPLHIPTHVMGLPLGIASNIRLFAPIGCMMLIYLVARGYRPHVLWPVLLTVMAAQFVLGFIGNSKEVSFQIPLLLLVGLYYLDGKIRKKILITMLIVGVPYLLFFNAYRTLTSERDYKTPAEALQAFGKNIDTVKRQTEGQAGVVSASLEGFAQRVDGKIYIDIIVAGTDSGRVSRLGGESLMWIFESFVPSFLWPEKPDITIGQRFNHEFHLSESQYTFVPTTQLGELYWNFGMAGVVVGMLFIGGIFGMLSNALLDRSGMTIPRFMTLLMSTYYIVVRFEDTIASQYTIFVRLLILIWLGDRVLRFLGLSVSAPPTSLIPEAESGAPVRPMSSLLR